MTKTSKVWSETERLYRTEKEEREYQELKKRYGIKDAVLRKPREPEEKQVMSSHITSGEA